MSSDLAQQLAGQAIFGELAADDLAALAAAGERRTVPAGRALVVEGEIADGLCLLLSGSARVWKAGRKGRAHELGTVQAGALLGEVGLLGGGERSATAEAEGEVSCFALEREAFERLVAARDDGALRLLQWIAVTLAQRQVETNERLIQLMEKTDDPEATLQLDAATIQSSLQRALSYRA